MKRQLSIRAEAWPIAGKFVISRETRTEAMVIRCAIVQDSHVGQGECVPYPRYGETLASVSAEIETLRDCIERGKPHQQVIAAMRPGAARNAIDCAFWDLGAKISGRPVAASLSPRPPRPLVTAYTISLGAPQEMAAATLAQAHRPLLKIKLGGDGDAERLRAVAQAAGSSRLIVDANEAWREADLAELLDLCAELKVAMVEQPLPAGRDQALARIARKVAVCADESVHVADDLRELADRYDAVNIKLDKAGGLTGALAMKVRARELGFQVMIGCMVGTSLAMAPAVLLAQDAEHVDLDGPLLLASDRKPALRYDGSLVYPPEPELWG